MPLGSGLAAQLGVGIEASYGAAVSVTRFLAFNSDSIEQAEDRMESPGLLAGRRVLTSEQWDLGNIEISGDLQLDLARQGLGGLWLQAFGSAATTTNGGASTHTFTPGDLTGKSLTVQVGRTQVGGVVTPFTYSGVKVNTWEVAADAGSIVTCTFGLIAQAVTTGTALASATYPQGVRAYNFVHGYAVVAGATSQIRSFRLSGDNGLDTDRRNLGSRSMSEPLESALRRYEGTLTIEWAATADYQRFVNGTELSLVLGFTASTTESAIFTANVRYDGYPVQVDGPDLLVPDIPFVAVANTSQDSSAISFAYRCQQTSPA